ncbi:MAG: protein-L-isoaspartate(D-aspartate) O-methyltransferase [Gammaproteobacteria bacterium]|nr:protein-L-isoaspartate(D-aspartate) O-methyltransferase [Gammaproteobacteria bacterium]
MTSARTRERLVQRLAASGIRNAAVLERVRNVPRHLFIDEALASRAYEDSALPIGQGQTISQPYIVALMTEALLQEGGRPLDKVLEVGTGCGYQTAILAPLVGKLFTIERIASLQRAARSRLNSLGIGNVRYRHGDGFEGWPGQAPFDAILVAAAPVDVPPALIEQLAPGGRLVIPVGSGAHQVLLRITRGPGGVDREQLGQVTFVPLVEGVDRARR